MIPQTSGRSLLVFGTLMLVVATWMPNGVAGGIRAVVRRIYRRPVAIATNPTGSGGAA
jgi:hypothetical protein